MFNFTSSPFILDNQVHSFQMIKKTLRTFLTPHIIYFPGDDPDWRRNLRRKPCPKSRRKPALRPKKKTELKSPYKFKAQHYKNVYAGGTISVVNAAVAAAQAAALESPEATHTPEEAAEYAKAERHAQKRRYLRRKKKMPGEKIIRKPRDKKPATERKKRVRKVVFSPLKKYFCKLCPAGYRSLGKLQVHAQMKHPSEQDESLGDHPPGLKESERSTFQHFTYTCNVCLQQFNTIQLLSMHATAKHPDHKKDALGDIITRTHDECPICHESIKRNNQIMEALTQHLWQIHGVKKEGYVGYRECEFCGYRTRSAPGFRYHVETRHKGNKPFMCDICGLKVTSSSTLAGHKRTHTNEKPYECQYCNKFFRTKKDCTRHEYTHSGRRPYQCILCSKEFTQINGINTHLRNHHKDIPKEEIKKYRRYVPLTDPAMLVPPPSKKEIPDPNCTQPEPLEQLQPPPIEARPRLDSETEMVAAVLAQMPKMQKPPPTEAFPMKELPGMTKHNMSDFAHMANVIYASGTTKEVPRMTAKPNMPDFAHMANVIYATSSTMARMPGTPVVTAADNEALRMVDMQRKQDTPKESAGRAPTLEQPMLQAQHQLAHPQQHHTPTQQQQQQQHSIPSQQHEQQHEQQGQQPPSAGTPQQLPPPHQQFAAYPGFQYPPSSGATGEVPTYLPYWNTYGGPPLL